MFTKFAKADVLEVKSAPAKARTASLAKFADFNDYKTDDGYIYVRVRAISSRVNKNNDGWPAAELQKSYRSFIGKPIFVDHHNTDPKRSRGVIVDAALHVEDSKTAALDPYYADAPEAHKPPTWIELLLEVDAKRFPRLAKAIVNGEIDSVSMGANVEMSKCSHCGNEAYSPEQFCKHVAAKGAYFDYIMPDGTKTSKRAYEDCHGVGFFEISFVFDPADETALVNDIKTSSRLQMIAAIQHEGQYPADDPYGERGYYDPNDPMQEQDYGDYSSPQMTEDQKVYQWRVEQFQAMGYSEEEAHVLAGQGNDWHDYEKLIGNGASPEQAHAIVSKIVEAEYKYVKKHGDKWVITQKGTGKVLSEHDSEEEAKSAFRAMEMHMHGATTFDTDYGPYQSAPCSCGPTETNRFGNCANCGRPKPSNLPAQTQPSQAWDEVGGGRLAHKTADQNPIPQSEMTTAPEKVDTLRQEQVCPICGSDMEDGICEVCNYEEPPEGFDNPDLSKAKEVDQQIHEQDAQQAAQGVQGPNDVEPTPNGPAQPMPSGAMPATSSTEKSAGSGAVSSEKTSANNGRVNTQERPILPVTRQLTDKPVAPKTIVKSPQKVESNRKDNDNNMTDTIKTADGAKAQGEGVQAENRVDVLGVGAVSGDPLSGIEHENVESDTGDFVAPHTDTWSDGEGDALGQQDPVTSEVFEGGGQGTGNAVGVSSPPPHNSATKTACGCCEDCGGPGCDHHENEKESSTRTADSSGDLGGPMGEAVGEGKGEKGGPTWDTSDAGFPDHDPARVDLFAPLKEEVGEGTKTFPGDDFHITDPVTKGQNANELGGPIGVAVAKAKAVYAKAFKVAEAEIALGLALAEKKFERVAELENLPEESLDGQLETLSKVRTAGLAKPKTSSQKTASAAQGTGTAFPSFSKNASIDIEAHAVSDDEFADSLTLG